jgi:hypothetical protein
MGRWGDGVHFAPALLYKAGQAERGEKNRSQKVEVEVPFEKSDV